MCCLLALNLVSSTLLALTMVFFVRVVRGVLGSVKRSYLHQSSPGQTEGLVAEWVDGWAEEWMDGWG